MLSIYYALASEAPPRFNQGEVNFFGSQPIPKPDANQAKPFVDMKKFDLKNQVLFIEGIAVLRGIHAQTYSDIDYELILKNTLTGVEYKKRLAKLNRPQLTRQLFDGDFVIYDKGYFTTMQEKGIDISDLPKAEYYLFISIKSKKQSAKAALVSSQNIERTGDNFLFSINKDVALFKHF